MNPLAKRTKLGNSKVGYKAAPANERKGYATHGSFPNKGQKGGKHGAIKTKPANEKQTDAHNVRTKTKMLVNNMFPALSDVRHARHQGKL